jgi:hypothetical protein
MSPPKSVATTWRDLLAIQEPAARGLIELHLEMYADIGEREADELPDVFSGADQVLARGILACGSEVVRPLLRLQHPFLPAALQALRTQKREQWQSAKWMLSFSLLAECMGTPRLPGFDSAVLQPLIRSRTELKDQEQRSASLLALAMGDTATARALVEAEPARYEQPVLQFEFNLYELIRYLADVVDQRRPPDWIEPAWQEFITGFPMHLAADAAEWPDLFYFARILANVRGDRVGQIADDLHARVHVLAQQGQ